MCRLLGVIGTPPLPVRPALEAFFPLATTGRVKCTMKPGHLDGWGLSGYHAQRAVYFERRAEPVTDSRPQFQEALLKAERSQTPVLFAHFRKASAGGRHIANTHPFHYRDWIFAHNGTVFNAGELPLGGVQPQGETDSERLMLWILDSVRTHEDPTAALVELLKSKRERLRFSSLTFLLSNGQMLWAYRDFSDKDLEAGETVEEREKYYTLFIARLGKSAIVCSEPLQAAASDWKPLGQRGLVVLSPTEASKEFFI